MDEQVIWLTSADLPPDIHGDKLDEWMRKKYSDERVLVEGYLSSFTQLLPELQLLIISFVSIAKCALLCRANKAFEDWLLPILYSRVKDMPVSLSEISRELSINHNSLVWIEHEKTTSVAVATNTDSNCMECVGAVMFISDPNQPSYIRVEPCSTHHSIRIDTVTEVEKISVDLFSERFILERRSSLIKHNKDYVKEQMTQRYNRAFAESTDKQKFILCYTAHLCTDGTNDTKAGTYSGIAGTYSDMAYYIRTWFDFAKETFSRAYDPLTNVYIPNS